MTDGRFYWLKLKRDFFKRHDIRIIESMPNGKDYILFYLKLLCESVDHDGALRFSESIPYNEQMLSTITDTNVDIVRAAIKIFAELGMMEVMDDGTYFMAEVQRMIGSAADNENANRQRKWREQKKLASLQNVTPVVTESNESKSKSKSKRIEIEEKKKNIQKKKNDLFDGLNMENAKLKDAMNAFVEMRRAMKKPMTPRAVSLLVSKLKEMASDEQTQIAIINQSVLNGWLSVYPLKADQGVNGVRVNPVKSTDLDGVF